VPNGTKILPARSIEFPADSSVYLEALYNAAIADWACGKAGAAIGRLQQHIARDDGDLVHFALGLIYSQLWYLDRAEAELTLVQNRGASDLINSFLALLRWRQNRIGEAGDELRKAQSGLNREPRFGNQFRLPFDYCIENSAWYIAIAHRAESIAKSSLPLDANFPDSTPDERNALFTIILFGRVQGSVVSKSERTSGLSKRASYWSPKTRQLKPLNFPADTGISPLHSRLRINNMRYAPLSRGGRRAGVRGMIAQAPHDGAMADLPANRKRGIINRRRNSHVRAD